MKILKHRQSVSYFYDNAMACFDDEDYITGLDYLHRALSDSGDTFAARDGLIKLQIADAYSEMGLYRMATQQYLRMMRKPNGIEEEVYMGMIRNLTYMNELSLAAHYCEEALEKGITEDFDGVSPLDILADGREEEEKEESPELRLVHEEDNEQLLNAAKQLMSGGELAYARQILETIPESSPQYREACGFLAYLSISDGDCAKSLEYAEKAAAGGDSTDRISADITRIMALDAMGKTAERNEAAERLDEAGSENWYDFPRIAACMAQIGNNELTHKYADAMLEHLPFDHDMSLLYALSCANLGQLQEAKDTLVDLQILFPEDLVARFYARQVFEYGGKQELELRTELPADTYVRVVTETEAWLTRQTDADSAARQLRKDADMAENVEFIIRAGPAKLAAALSSFLGQTSDWQPLLRDMLVEWGYPSGVKKDMLAALLKYAPGQRVDVTVNGILRSFYPHIPRVECKEAFKDVYWQVYSALAFLEKGYDKKLNAAFLLMVSALKNEKNPDPDAMTAALAYKARVIGVFNKQESVCEIFRCDKATFKSYVEKMRVQEKKPKTVKEAHGDDD